MFQLKNVTKIFSGGVRAVDDVSLSMSPGKPTAIIGANGAGKTTFIRLLLGLIEPSSGTIERDSRWEPGSRNLAAVLVGAGCFSDMTVEENIVFFGQVYGLTEPEARDAGARLLAQFGQSPLASRNFGKLSAGQQRIVSLCRALITNPTLLILDEISANLDPLNQRLILSFLNDYQATGENTVIFSSHDLGHVERFGGEILIFSSGRLAYALPSHEIGKHQCVTAKGLESRVIGSLREGLNYPCFLAGPGEVGAVCVQSEHQLLMEAFDKLGLDPIRLDSRQASLEDIYMAHCGQKE